MVWHTTEVDLSNEGTLGESICQVLCSFSTNVVACKQSKIDNKATNLWPQWSRIVTLLGWQSRQVNEEMHLNVAKWRRIPYFFEEQWKLEGSSSTCCSPNPKSTNPRGTNSTEIKSEVCSIGDQMGGDKLHENLWAVVHQMSSTGRKILTVKISVEIVPAGCVPCGWKLKGVCPQGCCKWTKKVGEAWREGYAELTDREDPLN